MQLYKVGAEAFRLSSLGLAVVTRVSWVSGLKLGDALQSLRFRKRRLASLFQLS